MRGYSILLSAKEIIVAECGILSQPHLLYLCERSPVLRAASSRVTASLLALGLVAGALVFGAAPAQAATTLTVASTADTDANNACTTPTVTAVSAPATLRNALCVASNLGGAVTVTVPAGTYAVNKTLVVGTKASSAITIAGASAASTIIRGAGAESVLTLDPAMVGGVSVSIDGVTLTGGAGDLYGGGAIIGGAGYAPADRLTIRNSVITGNRASSDAASSNTPGGGIQFIGGSLTISDSTISSNTSNASSGGGVAYQAMNAGDALSISRTTFTGNATGVGVANLPNGGAAISIDDTTLGGANVSISDSRFEANTGSGNASSAARGAAVWLRGGTLSLERSTLVANSIAGGSTAAGAAVHVENDAKLVAHFNRFTGNTGGHALAAGATSDATNNWWGCAGGPGATGCGTVSTPATATPWLTLTATANPVDIPFGDSTTEITASLLRNSAGTAVAVGNLTALENLPIAWSSPLPLGTSVSGATALVSGKAAATVTVGAKRGAGSVTATVDGNGVAVPFGALYPPSFTSAPSAEFTVGTAGTATISTDAYHPATITKSSSLPDGLTLGTSVLGASAISGTPADGTGGVYEVNLTADNSVGTPAQQRLDLTVLEAPEFTSPTTAIMTVGTTGSIQVVTDGYPAATLALAVPVPGFTLTDNGDGTATVEGNFTALGSGGLKTIGVTASNGVGQSASHTIDITVREAPTVTAQPADVTVNAGTSATFRVTSVGYPVPTVQWQVSHDGGATYSALAGKTGTSLMITAAQINDGDRYRAVLSSVAGVTASTGALLTVGTPPVFTSAGSASFTAGTASSFTVATAADPDAAITATGLPSWLSLTALGSGTARLEGTPPISSGGTYPFTLSATNGFDPTASQPFILAVVEAPQLAGTNATSITVGDASGFTITPAPIGYPLPTYAVTGTLPQGITYGVSQGKLVFTSTSTAGVGGTYPVTVTASNGSGTSTQALEITVNERPTVVTSPASARINSGADATFTAAASGYPVPTVQWQMSTDGGVTFVDVAGAVSANYTVTTTLAMDGNLFRAVFANGVGTPVTTTNALLEVGSATTVVPFSTTFDVGRQQMATVVTTGSPVATSIVLSGAPAWASLVNNGDGTATLTANPPLGSGGVHGATVTASNGYGTPYVENISLTVVESAAITSAATAAFTAGTAGTFTATATAGYPVATTISVVGTLPTGLTASGGVIAGTAAPGTGGTYSVQVVASNGAASDATQKLTITVEEGAIVTAHPVAAKVGVGTTATFVAAASGFPTPTVQWEVSHNDGVSYTTVPGATAATLTLTPTLADSGAMYRARFANGPVVTTNPAVLTVGISAAITTPAVTTFTVGTEGSFSVDYEGTAAVASVDGMSTGLATWLTVSHPAPGEMVLTGTPPAGSGGPHPFTVSVTNDFGLAANQNFVLTVTEAASLAPSGSATFAKNMAGSTTIAVTGGFPAPALTASHSVTGVTFTDNLDGTMTLSGTPTGSGTFAITIVADNGIGSAATMSFVLTVTEDVTVTGHPSGVNVSAGSAAVFVASATGHPTPAVQWLTSVDSGSTWAAVPGATNPTLSFTATQADDGALFMAEFTGHTVARSASAKLTVGTPAQITSGSAVVFVAGAGAQTATLTSTGVPAAAFTLTGAPSWLTLVDNGDGTAVLHASPSAAEAGPHSATVAVYNGYGSASSQVLTIDVTTTGAFTSAAGATFAVGSAGSFAVTTTPGHPAFGPLSVAGALPTGVAFVADGTGAATLAGTPAAGTGGVYDLVMRASNGSTPVTQAFRLVVTEAPSITSDPSATFVIGVDSTFAITTGGGHPVATSVALTGALPAGLTFTDNGDGTASISGTPTDAVGSVATVQLVASNGVASSAPRDLVITTIAAPKVVLPPMVPISDGALTGFSPSLTPGETITVEGSGFAAGAPVTIGIYSVPRELKTVTADAFGRFVTSVVIPADMRGPHTLVAVGIAPDGSVRRLVTAIALPGADGSTGAASMPATGATSAEPVLAIGLGVLVVGGLLLGFARLRRRQR